MRNFLLSLTVYVALIPGGEGICQTLYNVALSEVTWNFSFSWSLSSGGTRISYVADRDLVWDNNSFSSSRLITTSTGTLTFNRSQTIHLTSDRTLTSKDVFGTQEHNVTFRPSSSTSRTLTWNGVNTGDLINFSGRLQNNGSGALSLTKGGEGILKLEHATSNTMSGAVLVNDSVFGETGLIITGNMSGASSFTVNGSDNSGAGNHGRRLAADGTLSQITLNAGADNDSGGAQLHIGGEFGLGIPGADLDAASLVWNGGSGSTDSAKLFIDLDVDFEISDTLVLSGEFGRGTGSYFGIDFNGADFSGIDEIRTFTLVTFGSTSFADASGITAENVDLGSGSGEFLLGADSLQFQFTPIPEPGTVAFVIVGLASLMFLHRRGT